MAKLTNKQLVDENIALRASLERYRVAYTDLKNENARLTARIIPSGVVRTTPYDTSYPLVDKIGRCYRQEGNVRCYPARN